MWTVTESHSPDICDHAISSSSSYRPRWSIASLPRPALVCSAFSEDMCGVGIAHPRLSVLILLQKFHHLQRKAHRLSLSHLS